MNMSIIDYFKNNVDKFQNKYAVVIDNNETTYSELSDQVKQLCLFLKGLGVTKGDKILLVLANTLEYVQVMLAAADIGAVIVPLSSTLSVNAIKKAVSVSDASFIIATHSIIKKISSDADNIAGITNANIIVVGGSNSIYHNYNDIFSLNSKEYELGENKISNDDDYILTMTSGSTGDPKPIVFTQNTKLERAIRGAQELYNLTHDEVILTGSPLYHSLGQRLVLLPLIIGATSVVMSKFTPNSWLKLVDNYHVTFTIAISSQLEAILSRMKTSDYDLSSLKVIVSSSALLKDEIKKECIRQFSCDFHECYGASEVGIVTNLFPDDSSGYLKSVGKALSFVEMKIVDENRNELPLGEVGEIICKSPTSFSRYYKQPETTAKSVIGGYFYTGDLGKIDKDGYLYFCGRKKELIIVGGTNVYPGDVEAVLNSCPEVIECAVIGVEDAYFGEAILAVLILKDHSANLADIRHRCEDELADYQMPMAYEVVEQLPKNALGKLMKHKLQKKFKGYDATAKFRAILFRN